MKSRLLMMDSSHVDDLRSTTKPMNHRKILTPMIYAVLASYFHFMLWSEKSYWDGNSKSYSYACSHGDGSLLVVFGGEERRILQSS